MIPALDFMFSEGLMNGTVCPPCIHLHDSINLSLSTICYDCMNLKADDEKLQGFANQKAKTNAAL